MYRIIPKTRWVPKGAVKVTDKQSDSVAYLFLQREKLAALVYWGKQSDPALYSYYKTAEARAKAVASYFQARQRHNARKAENAAERKAAGPGLVVGDIVNTCWGYEQTNREFFEVLAVKGKMVTLRELCQAREYDGWAMGRCVPQAGEYRGEAFKRLARNGYVKIDDVRGASKWNTATVAGVAVGPAASFSEYG